MIALTEAELCAFFPNDLRGELFALFPTTCVLQGSTTKQLTEFLVSQRSQVLLSCWQTPPLTTTLYSDLRYVCHVTGSVRSLVPRSLIEAGLVVSNWGDGAADTVAEGILMLMLASLRQTQYWGREMHERGEWRTDNGGARTLFDRTIAIHGFGRIARALIDLLVPFRTTNIAYSEGVPVDYIRRHGAEPVDSLNDLFSSGADIVVEIEALTQQSAGTVRQEHFNSMKAGSVYINSGRGAVVDEHALERVAVEGRIHVALDVYATEPLPKHSPLRGLPNVTLMPHIGGPTVDRYPAIGRYALDNLHRWLDGRSLAAQITLPIYDSST